MSPLLQGSIQDEPPFGDVFGIEIVPDHWQELEDGESIAVRSPVGSQPSVSRFLN